MPTLFISGVMFRGGTFILYSRETFNDFAVLVNDDVSFAVNLQQINILINLLQKNSLFKKKMHYYIAVNLQQINIFINLLQENSLIVTDKNCRIVTGYVTGPTL